MNEVTTPALYPYSPTDPNIEPFSTKLSAPCSDKKETLYLATSPEFRMKEMLCNDSGDIYQICRAFRNEEMGSLHLPDFTILEWYRLEYDEFALMGEVEDLCKHLFPKKFKAKFPKKSYQELFLEYAKVDPFGRKQDIISAASKLGYEVTGVRESRDFYLDYIMVNAIDHQLKNAGPIFVHSYPASQAALAELHDTKAETTAKRFELFIDGLEICNGFKELQNPKEQKNRFHNDIKARKIESKPELPMDVDFLKSLKKGLPNCSGVAIGLDRLFAVGHNHKKILPLYSK